MNGYAALDPALKSWTQRHGLHLITRSHYETELRQLTIVDDCGDTYGVSLTAPESDEQVGITLYLSTFLGSSHPRRTQLFRCHLTQLPDTLELVYATVETWIGERGHRRTPVL